VSSMQIVPHILLYLHFHNVWNQTSAELNYYFRRRSCVGNVILIPHLSVHVSVSRTSQKVIDGFELNFVEL